MTKYWLYKESNLLEGIGSVIDVFAVSGSNRYNEIMNNSDNNAIKNDWQKIGNDFTESLEKTKNTNNINQYEKR